MTLSVDWASRVVNSDSSILDIVAFKDELRLLEESETGILYPPIITYKKVDSGGGAFQHFVEFINSYLFKFPVAGDYLMQGNINATIDPTPNVYVERLKATSFVSSSGGDSGLTEQDKIDIVQRVWSYNRDA